MSTLTENPNRLRVMMIGPYPQSPDKIDGGVASAVMYLSQALAVEPDIDLIGVRIAKGRANSCQSVQFSWPVADLSLGRLGLTTFYRRQKHRLEVLINQYRPDIVHGQGADIAGFLAVGCGLPTVVTVHGLLGECARFQTDPASKARAVLAAMLTERNTVRRATDLIAISPYVTRYYQKDIRGRIHDVPNAVAPNFFGIARVPERGRLLYAGRIAHGKGLIELLQAVARNRATVTRLVLAGAAPDPGYQNLVREEAARMNLSECVQFAGLLREPALLEELARAEALMLPSHQETAPMVVQEAMAAGLAVIATNVGGIPEQLEHEVSGLLFEPGDVNQMTALIARLGNDQDLSRRLGAAAKAVAIKRYQASAVARATIAVYRTMLDTGRQRARR
jgi:glycosyltransferase involved in cell wall biosynthesis